MRENPDIGLGHHTGSSTLVLVLDKQQVEDHWPFQVQFGAITSRTFFDQFSKLCWVKVFTSSISSLLLLRENPDPGSRDPEAGRAPFQTSRCLRRWPGWLARCPSRLLALLHPLLEESRLTGNHPPKDDYDNNHPWHCFNILPQFSSHPPPQV